jgi:hypothetical protein
MLGKIGDGGGMKPSFSLKVDAERNLLRVTLAGFFEPADIAAFVQARNAAYALLRCAPNQHVTLVDIRDMDIQSQDSVAEFNRVLSDPAGKGKRLAFIVAKSLARLQVKRAAAGRYAAYFVSEDDAEQWLMNDIADAA